MSKRSQGLHLKIGEVPKYPFVNQPFEVVVHLVDDNGQLKCGDEIPLNIKLCYDEKPLRDFEENILASDTPKPHISKSGTATISCRITDLSMRYENKKFVLYTSVESPSGTYIKPAMSEPMLAIRYRLVIDTSHIPDVWYKDEGGRDKCIDLFVNLRDHNGELIVARKVPLKVTLQYDSGHNVVKQDILKINPENKLMIDESGRALLRLRIDDVSKNHQKQQFVVHIAPDTVQHPLNNDISPDACPPIEVRSKRNKRTRDSTEGNDRGGGATRASHSSSVPPTHPNTIQRTETKTSASSTRMPLINTSTPPGSVGLPTSLSAITSPAVVSNGSAINTLIDWMNMVVDGLSQIQWRQIGTEKLTDDGQCRPMYEMSNPNTIVADMLQKYDEFAVPSATHLYREIFYGQDDCSDVASTSTSNTKPTRHDQDSYRAGSALLGLAALQDREDNMELAIPSRERDQSIFSGMPEDLPGVIRATTSDIFDALQYSVGTGSQTAEASNVHYVLVKKFHSKNLTVPLGCPAYDSRKQLVGFYVGESEKTSGWHDQEQTSPKFCPVGDYPSRMLSIDELNKANAALQFCIDNRDNSVFCRTDFENESKMIEEALIRWYMGADNVYLWEGL